MLAYLIRSLLYAIPILIGVNLITFALFFIVNTPDDMARMQLGVKRVMPEAIEKWKAEHTAAVTQRTVADERIVEQVVDARGRKDASRRTER